jgi:hypothetical protein
MAVGARQSDVRRRTGEECRGVEEGNVRKWQAERRKGNWKPRGRVGRSKRVRKVENGESDT